MSRSVLENYLTKSALASQIQRTERTLDRWHTERRGPRRTKIGKSVYYNRESVADWLRDQEETEASQ